MSVLGWINFDDEDQTDWALKYLTERVSLYSPLPYHPKDALAQLSLDPQTKHIQPQMKKAWYARVRRQKRKSEGEVQRLIPMDESTVAQLAKLTKLRGWTIRDTVADLVERAFRLETDAREQLKQAKGALKVSGQRQLETLRKQLAEAKFLELRLQAKVSALEGQLRLANIALEESRSLAKQHTSEQMEQAKPIRPRAGERTPKIKRRPTYIKRSRVTGEERPPEAPADKRDD